MSDSEPQGVHSRSGFSPDAFRGPGAGKQDLLIVVALVLLALAFRLYSLQFFHVISTDGTSYVGSAQALGRGDLGGIGTYGLYPVLIWVAGWFVSDLELAGRVVSIISGSLLVAPLYLLGREILSRREALCASLMVVVWPPLVSSSCEVMTQASYDFIQIFAIFLVWRMFQRPSAPVGVMAGLCVGLAFLTRPEGLLLFLLPPLPFLILYRRELRQRWTMPLAYVAGFSVLFVLNLLLVHHVTGEWQLSAKTDSALNDALSYYLKIPDLNYIPGYEPKGYLDIIRDHPGFIWTNSLKNLRELVTLLPVWLWMLIATGFFVGGFSSRVNAIRLFLLATLAPLAVLIVFYYVSPGYIEAYLPVFFLWGAGGLCLLEKLLGDRLENVWRGRWRALYGKIPLAVSLTIVCTLQVFASQLRADVPDSAYHWEMDNGRRAEKHIGLLLKENLPPGKIMTRWARIAFYAERDWVNIPAGVPFDSVIRTARENGVRFLVADGVLYSNRPQLGHEIFSPLMDEEQPYGTLFMTDPTQRIMGLRPYLLYTDPKSFGVVVYEIPPESE